MVKSIRELPKSSYKSMRRLEVDRSEVIRQIMSSEDKELFVSQDIIMKRNIGIGMNQAGAVQDWMQPDMTDKAAINLQAVFQNVGFILKLEE